MWVFRQTNPVVDATTTLPVDLGVTYRHATRGSVRYLGVQDERPQSTTRNGGRNFLMTETYDDLESLCYQEVFSTLFRAALLFVGDIGRIKACQPDSYSRPTWVQGVQQTAKTTIRLRNSQIHDIAVHLKNNGLYSLKGVYICMVSLLRKVSKLSSGFAAHDDTRKVARSAMVDDH